MEIILGKHAGFCYGVKRAVDIAQKHALDNEKIYTLGPLIHNEEVIRDLESKGIVSLSEDELSNMKNEKVIIRSHGVSKSVIDRLKKNNHEIIDATCPFVKKIHDIVSDYSKKGYHVIILGDPNHAEVVGIVGWIESSDYSIIYTKKDAINFDGPHDKKYCIVAQTTFNSTLFKDYVEIITQKGYDVDTLDTICSATHQRQREALEIASKVGAMIVIGDRNSSNSRKLFDIAKSKCKAYFIQTKSDLDLDVLHSIETVGITAGASTPDNIIREVMLECQK